MTAALAAFFYLIYFQAIGPATNWAPWGSQPTMYGGVWGLLVIIFAAVGFGVATLIQFDIRRGYVKKPKLVVQS